MTSPQHALLPQSKETLDRLEMELYARMLIARGAIQRFASTNGAAEITEAIGVEVFRAALADFPLAVESVLQVRTIVEAGDKRVDAIIAEAREEPPAEEACSCCTPPVPLSRHTHAPIKGVQIFPLTKEDVPADGVVTYRPGRGGEQRVRLGPDNRVEVQVSGHTWAIKDELRSVNLRWNGDKGTTSLWEGRLRPGELERLAPYDIGPIVVRILEDVGAPAARPARASRAEDRPGGDFYS